MSNTGRLRRKRRASSALDAVSIERLPDDWQAAKAMPLNYAAPLTSIALMITIEPLAYRVARPDSYNRLPIPPLRLASGDIPLGTQHHAKRPPGPQRPSRT